ncbi:MAG: PQQ-binding-like beta-propeller repeat protein, partial [Firmicutes bacterium]|nr:PQQ-binding-like beta-propeller repeat protein [Bacillota bacterium]
SENGGMFYCIDLNTMELIWAQDTKDDSNSTPVFERVAEDEGYIYTAPSLHWTKDSNDHGTVSIYKLDAMTGEILWEHPYECYTVEGVSGGVQSSPLLGKEGESIEGMIIYSISRSPGKEEGILVALDTETGDEIWRLDLDYYAWSSPVGVYDEDGTVYVVLCDSAGHAFLVEGTTGKVLGQTFLEGLVEASPVVYEDTLVVGTRDRLICGMKVK